MGSEEKMNFEFRVGLDDIEPPIWRTIKLSASSTFWDLHVAIQDAMGWLDYHLHEFEIQDLGDSVRIGLPYEESLDELLPSWIPKLDEFFDLPGESISYTYDFGDGWAHDVKLIGVTLAKPKEYLPVCTGGERACPPEDCGGVQGYKQLLLDLKSRSPKKREELKSWLENHAKNYWPYDAERFDPSEVTFQNAKLRLKRMLKEQKF